MLRVRKHREESPGPSSPPLEAGEEEEEEEEVSTDDEDCFAGDRAGWTVGWDGLDCFYVRKLVHLHMQQDDCRQKGKEGRVA